MDFDVWVSDDGVPDYLDKQDVADIIALFLSERFPQAHVQVIAR